MNEDGSYCFENYTLNYLSRGVITAKTRLLFWTLEDEWERGWSCFPETGKWGECVSAKLAVECAFECYMRYHRLSRRKGKKVISTYFIAGQNGLFAKHHRDKEGICVDAYKYKKNWQANKQLLMVWPNLCRFYEERRDYEFYQRLVVVIED